MVGREGAEGPTGARTSQPVLMVNVEWPNHDDGGYGALTRFLPGETMVYPWSTMVANPATRVYSTARFNLGLRRRADRAGLIHMLYADTTIAPGLLGLEAPIISTLHIPLEPSPPTRLVDRVRESVVRRSSGIIVLSSREAEIASERYPHVPVRFIPHGIDVTAYGQEPFKTIEPSFAVVGSNFRDWAMLESILDGLKRKGREWPIHLVGVPEQQAKYLASVYPVLVHGRLSADDYRALISASWAVLLPLKQATANNAVLEAHALGTTVISSRITGISDYSVRSTRYFVSAVEAIDLLEDVAATTESSLMELSSESVVDSHRFDWGRVSQETQSFYRDCCDRGGARHVENPLDPDPAM